MRFFCLPKIILFFASIFYRTNSRKSMILAFQNAVKTVPKSIQNPRPKKHAFFSLNFARQMLCCNSAGIDFLLFFPMLFACRALFFESLFECILVPKNLPKTIPKRRPNPLKIDVKNGSFFNIGFFRASASILEPLGPPTWSQVG